MRSGFLISAASHAALVALVFFGAPKLFDETSVASVEVELVQPEEIEKPPEPEKPKEQKPDWSPVPPDLRRQTETAPTSPQNAPPTQQKQAALAPPPPPTPGAGPQPPGTTPSIFDPANIPALLNLPTAPDKGFDSEALTTANISDGDRAALKAHLRKCWKPPAGLSAAQTRVVLRVNLRRDGRLANDPLLIEAPASSEGPLILETAVRALKECQPFALPVEKYREWRLLDLSFSPREMAGG